MRTSPHGIALIKHFEGCETTAYQCSANVWTIGYGHTRGVREGDKITEDKAEYLLLEDLKHFEGFVDRLVEVNLNQDQFDALVSWTFNLGPTNLGESTLLRSSIRDTTKKCPVKWHAGTDPTAKSWRV